VVLHVAVAGAAAAVIDALEASAVQPQQHNSESNLMCFSPKTQVQCVITQTSRSCEYALCISIQDTRHGVGTICTIAVLCRACAYALHVVAQALPFVLLLLLLLLYALLLAPGP
jgi:uncharacterized secreted protein with C-terminal beta-propeller domain